MCDCEGELNNLSAADDIMLEVITRLTFMSFKFMSPDRIIPSNYVCTYLFALHHNNVKNPSMPIITHLSQLQYSISFQFKYLHINGTESIKNFIFFFYCSFHGGEYSKLDFHDQHITSG